ncbi:hypothetical protein [Candidatus Endoriftia persephonae]|jgi:hypothetical protein|uniref:Transmembrane protein n=2 Tax=Gammaproteobacteria TaxID=1236 RepID=G2FIR7_9GAMM|nr:hypothetical protein [Candidatus Endoriftia persephone]EGW53310.1 hypothetical protein TevJSym_bf00160 [endosymbiont of Tevnia jerichonana (vent Tica)]USF86153.1 hypothetical protein L0Y14_08290 [Candidatus Endoriftia persephone]
MLFDVDEATRKRAKAPHEIFMLNLAGFHLMMAPAAIVMDVGYLGFLIPLALSLCIIALLWIRATTMTEDVSWFVRMHWRLAANRTRILLVGYLISGTIIGLALLATSGSDKGGIMMVALSRVAIVPVLLTVMACFVLESSGIYQAQRFEVPDGLVKRFPPPDDLPRWEAPEAVGSSPKDAGVG